MKKKTAQTDIKAFLKNQGYRSLGTLHVQRSGLRYHIKMLTWKVKRTVSLTVTQPIPLPGLVHAGRFLLRSSPDLIRKICAGYAAFQVRASRAVHLAIISRSSYASCAAP